MRLDSPQDARLPAPLAQRVDDDGYAARLAKLLGVQPQIVYRWMAELEQPSQAHVNTSRLRLKEAFAAKRATAMHPRRRASVRPAKLYLAVSAS